MKKVNKATAIILAVLCIVFSFSACSATQEKVELTTFKNATTEASESGSIVAMQMQTQPKSDESSNASSTTAQNTSTSKSTSKQTTAKKSTAASPKKNEQKDGTTKPTKKASTTKKANAPPKSEDICYITIECKSILKHLDKLAPGHEKYVPSDGYLLRKYSCKYKSGDTAYDILKRSCAAQDIKITATDSMYGVYIAGINNIDEKDCGNESGWLYSVNGKFPNITCGKQDVKPNDEILFTYTCEYK